MVNEAERPYSDLIVWPGLANAGQLPATNVPIGLSSDNMPIGMQIIGPYLEDRTTIEFAKLITEITGGFLPPIPYN
jgi:amidase